MRKKPAATRSAPCEHCGKEFVTSKATRRFCSARCCHVVYWAKVRPAKVKSLQRRCRYCGDALPLRHRVICKKLDCRRKLNNDFMRASIARRREGETRSCLECQKPYHHWGRNSKWPATCSPDCQRQRKNRQSREQVRSPLSPKSQEHIREKYRRQHADPEFRAKYNERTRDYDAYRREVALLRDLDGLAAAGEHDDRRGDT